MSLTSDNLIFEGNKLLYQVTLLPLGFLLAILTIYFSIASFTDDSLSLNIGIPLSCLYLIIAILLLFYYFLFIHFSSIQLNYRELIVKKNLRTTSIQFHQLSSIEIKFIVKRPTQFNYEKEVQGSSRRIKGEIKFTCRWLNKKKSLLLGFFIIPEVELFVSALEKNTRAKSAGREWKNLIRAGYIWSFDFPSNLSGVMPVS